MFWRRIAHVSSLCLIALGGCNTDDSTTNENAPSILKIRPFQVSRGQQNIKGKITGNNFIGNAQVSLGDGVDVQSASIENPTTIAVTFSVRPDASSGPRIIKVTTAAGTAQNSKLFSINDNGMP